MACGRGAPSLVETVGRYGNVIFLVILFFVRIQPHFLFIVIFVFQVFGPATIVHLAITCLAWWSMWQSARTHPVSLWVRTEGSMTSTSAWRWRSAPASSSVAVLSWRRRDSWGWPGRARWEQVWRWSVFNAKLQLVETVLEVRIPWLRVRMEWRL